MTRFVFLNDLTSWWCSNCRWKRQRFKLHILALKARALRDITILIQLATSKVPLLRLGYLTMVQELAIQA